MGDEELSNVQTQVLPPAEAIGPLAAGTLLFGAYEIVDLLGSGGMGAVYRARHLQLGGMRAIKVMHPELITRPESLERFYREARALLQVRHDAVVHCHDLLQDERRVYLVMELIEGVPLSQRMRETPLDEREVFALGRRLAAGLAAAHAAGVVHRDLSPDNVVLPQGLPELAKIIDFGIAKVMQGADRTVAGGFKGKLSYASPEQLGLYGGEVDPRSDLYSLGLVLAAASLGAPLDMGHQIAESVSVRTLQIALPRQVPPRLKRGIEPLLVADPKQRVQSAEDFLQSWEEATRSSARRRGLRAPAVVVLLLLAGLGAAVTARWWLQEPAAEPPKQGVMTQAPPGADFGSLRQWLLSARGNAPALRPVIRTRPDPVPDGEPYSVIVAADCACSALVFELDGSTDRIGLLYPNPFEPALPLEAARDLEIPTSDAYSLAAVRGTGTDRLRLIVVEGTLEFPPPDLRQWDATPGQRDRLLELSALAALLQERRWAGAETVLAIAP